MGTSMLRAVCTQILPMEKETTYMDANTLPVIQKLEETTFVNKGKLEEITNEKLEETFNEKLEETNAKNKQEGTQRMLAMLLGSQAELMQKAMFTAWHELVAVMKKDRETERMKAAMKAKGDESSKRMLAMLMGSQMDVLKKASFAGWWEHV